MANQRFDDEHAVRDRFAGVGFQFYTDEEIEKLSVREIVDPVAFDHLNNPTKQGLHDKALGVSPFDHKSTCQTCGMTMVHCPGHVGHINLAAPIYNPFLMKDVYKLLKSKCFSCNRMRIHASKIDTYIMCLKLLKAGDLVVSQELKQYFLHAAAKFTICSDATLTDKSKVKKMKAQLDSIAPSKKQRVGRDIQELDLPGWFTKIEHSINERKEGYEEELQEKMQEIIDRPEMELQANTSTQKRIQDLIKEIWSQVVTTTCPHCKHKSPAVKRDGFTKLFIKPLAARSAMVQRQAKNLSSKQRSRSRDSTRSAIVPGEEGKLEQHTNASSVGGNSSIQRKASANTEIDEISSEEDPEMIEDVAEVDESSEEEYKEGASQKYITPIEVEDHIRKLWVADGKLLGLMYGRFDPKCPFNTNTSGFTQFFQRKVIVPPSRFRPESEGGLGGAKSSGDRAFLHTHSAMLTKVIQRNIALSEALIEQRKCIETGLKPDAKIQPTQKWIQLQDAVNIFMDSSMAQKTVDKTLPGVRQLLERKEGMFRMKMMGKRVNFGGRSVISPDPNITTDQIGVPVFMARKLTFPESVSKVSIERLRALVRNGSSVHPGANMIEDEDTGHQILLQNMPQEDRDGIADQLQIGKKIVHRHLSNGDVLLVNRQPTLHKPSMMAHIAKVLPKEQTIRMHYANCNTYNADFDGDEMNLHLPQSYQAASEAYKLMATHKQYVVPTSGKPIRGLIQDSVVSGVFMSSKSTFLNKDDYMQLVYAGLRELITDNKLHRVTTLPPTILKPKPLWTGKQVISTVLKNIVLSGLNPKEAARQSKICGMNLDSKSRLNAKEWGPLGSSEGEVVIRDNEHLQGTLDKNAFGASDQGMVHSFYELYGSEKAGILLTSLARIFALFLQTHGFTCGLEDLVLKPQFNKERRMTIEKCHKNGVISAAKFANVSGYSIQQLNYSGRVVFQSKKNFDADIQKYTDMVLPEDPFNGKKKCMTLDDPIRVQIEQKIGQSSGNSEELEIEFDNVMKSTMGETTSKILKDCIPDGLVKRFPQNMISAMVQTGAKGGIVNQTQISALLGQQELEGRRVPRMQNGKTLPCFMPFDPNPRASGYVSDRFISGLRPQDFFFHCMAGREGLIDTAVKTSRSGYLQRCLIKQLESLMVSYDMTVRDNDGSIVQFMYGDDGVDVMQRQFLDKFNFLERNYSAMSIKAKKLVQTGAIEIEPIKKEHKQVLKKAKQLMQKDSSLNATRAKQMAADPLISKFNPLVHFGAISENMGDQMRNFLKKNSLCKKIEIQAGKAPSYKFPLINEEDFKQMYYMKYLKSVAHPGENVGTIAAQSIGEPSTQMTLNTFHLAGHGGANMTLGIPRLKEILMTTPTNIKTPFMTVYFKKGQDLNKDQMQKIAKHFEKLQLTEVVKNVGLSQAIAKGTDGNFKRLYKLTLEFEDANQVESKLGLKFNHLCKAFTDRFVPKIMDLALKDLRKAAEQEIGGIQTGGIGTQNVNEVKNILLKTTKVTKVSRGETLTAPEETELIGDVNMIRDDDDDDEDEEKNADMAMDTDGDYKKQKVTGYGDDESEVGGSNAVVSEQGELAVDFGDEEVVDDVTLKKEDISEFMKVLREKYSKYLPFIKGDLEFVEDKSATITLQFPLEFKKLLILTLTDAALKTVLIRSHKDIDKVMLVTPTKTGSEPYLLVQGINFPAFERFPDVFDLVRTETNHSYALKQRYGVEACRANIVKEIKRVFDVYGINVDYRHLSLIADFITYNGDYRAFNRIGMEESSSPFLKMSYETTMKYLIASSTSKDTDWIKSPASALVLGLAPQVGTNSFDLIHDTRIRAK